SPRYFYMVTDDVDVALGNGGDLLRVGPVDGTSRYKLPDDLRIDMGADGSADAVDVRNFSLRDSNDRIRIATGGGADGVRVEAVNSRWSLSIDTGSGGDVVVVNSVRAEALSVNTGDGD